MKEKGEGRGRRTRKNMIAILELGNAFEDWNGGETGRVESKRL